MLLSGFSSPKGGVFERLLETALQWPASLIEKLWTERTGQGLGVCEQTLIHFDAQLLQRFLLRLAEPAVVMFVHEPGKTNLLLLGESLQRHDHGMLLRLQLSQKLLGQLLLELGRELLDSRQCDFQGLVILNHIREVFFAED
jgi:hypothetical protein